MKAKYHVYTDIPGTPGRFWGDHTVCCGPTPINRALSRLIGGGNARRVAELTTAFRLLGLRPKVEAYITSGTLIGITLACLQTLCFWNRKPHVLIDCLWYTSASSLRNLIFSWCLKIASPSVTKFVVWASHELEDYPRAFSLDPAKFEYVHFWHTLRGYDFSVDDEGYVFAGGNWDRDYITVLKAASNLPNIPFRIGTTRPEQVSDYEIPSNVLIKGYTHDGFRKAIAACRIMLVPMVKDVLHSGGQQTVLNAMYMGKPTIAIGRRWAEDLIEDGKNGCIVDYENPDELSKTIQELWDNPERLKRMSEEASAEGASWPSARSLEIIYRMALSAEGS